MVVMTTKSVAETKQIARVLAQKIAARPDRVGTRGAAVLALSGELGAGKTTFAQGFAMALGVKENVLSPTFVLMKIYPLRLKSKVQNPKFRHLIHIDCYRLASPKDILQLGFKEILKDEDAIILIEWADRIRKILPRDAIWLKFSHGVRQHERRIAIDGVFSG